MEEDKLREIAKQEMTNAIMNNIDSTLIFTYIKNLEDMNEVLEQENQSYKDYYGTPPCYDNAKYILKSKVKEKIEELDIRIGEFCENIDKSVDEEKTYWKKEKHDAIMQRFILQEMLED